MIKKNLCKYLIEEDFLCGHLSHSPNKGLVYPIKQNNMGIPLGTINNYNAHRGYITLKLQNTINIGDSISIDGESGSYKVSELLVNDRNSPTASSRYYSKTW